MIDRPTAFRFYLRMRLTKENVRGLALRTGTAKTTLHDWYLGNLNPHLDDISRWSQRLNCPELVILGFEPCLANCPDCEHFQP